jgi:hypothetical protein
MTYIAIPDGIAILSSFTLINQNPEGGLVKDMSICTLEAMQEIANPKFRLALAKEDWLT